MGLFLGTAVAQSQGDPNAPIVVNPGPERLRILFVGNSITRHAPRPSVGWNQTSGMAANAEATDYAHRFRDFVERVTGRVTDPYFHTFGGGGTVAQRLGAFEQVRMVEPHIVVIQLGEHEVEAEGTEQLRTNYRALLQQARSWSPMPWVVALGSWSPQASGPPNAYDNGWVGQRDTVMREEAEALGIPFLSVRAIAENPANWGTGSDPGVQWHPNDLGHAEYARLLQQAFLNRGSGLVIDGDIFARPNTAFSAASAPHPVGSPWSALRGQWAIQGRELAARRQLLATDPLFIHGGVPLSLASREQALITTTARLTNASSSEFAGIAFGVSSASSYYALRYSRAGVVQLIRVNGGSPVALANISVGSGRFDGPTRLSVAVRGAGNFHWRIEGPTGTVRSGEVLDPDPLPGRHTGLYANIPWTLDGQPRAFFESFAVAAPQVSFFDRFENQAQILGTIAGIDVPGSNDWRAMDSQGSWEIARDRLTGARTGSSATFVVNERTAQLQNGFRLRADLLLTADGSSHYAGLVFHASAADTYYVLRYNLPGNVQLLRYRKGQLTVMENLNLGGNRLGGRVTVSVESDRPGHFVYSLHNARGERMTRRTVTDPAPLFGGRAGIYTNSPAVSGQPTLFVHRFSYNPEKAVVQVDAESSAGNAGLRHLMGQLVVGANPVGIYYAGSQPEFFATRRAHGLWDPVNRRPEPETMAILQNYQPGVLRYPDGLGVHGFNWRHTVGPLLSGSQVALDDHRSRTFHFGLNEFLQIAEAAGAEPVMVVSEYTGTDAAGNHDIIQSAADLVAYLNLPISSGHPMAILRGQHGFPEPWNVRFFEIGNESWVDFRLAANAVLPPTQVGQQAAAMIAAMKAVDPSILCGVPHHLEETEWGAQVFGAAGSAPDYAIFHVYPINYGGPNLAEAGNGESAWLEDRLMQMTLLAGVSGAAQIRENLHLLRQVTGNPQLPAAITEFNVGMAQSGVTHGYRFSLGAAIGMGDLITRMAEPDSGVLFAIYWQWLNGFWGSVRQANLSNMMFNYSGAGNFPPVVESLRAPHYLFTMLGSMAEGRRVPVSVSAPPVEGSGFGRSMPVRGGSDRSASRRSSQNLLLNSFGSPNFIPPAPPYAGLSHTNTAQQYNLRFDHFAAASATPGIATVDLTNIDAALRPSSGGILYRTTFEARWEPDNPEADSPTLGLQVGDLRGFPATGSASYIESLQVANQVWQSFTVEYQPLPDTAALGLLVRVTGPGQPFSGTLRLRNMVTEAWNAPTVAAPPALSATAVRTRSQSGDPGLSLALFHLSDFEEREVEIHLPELGQPTAWVQTLGGSSAAAYRVASEQNPDSPDPGGAITVSPAVPLPVEDGVLRLQLPPHSLTRVDVALPDTRTPYQKWRDQTFGVAVTEIPELEESVWGTRADPDGTGIPNLLRFAFGYQGNVEAARSPLSIQWTDAGLELQFLPRGAGLHYIVETSTDLRAWHSIFSEKAPPGLLQRIEIPLEEGEQSRFFRLKITE
jgi:alpha-N-arabinofuranosidase